jgi:DNA repair exonuclease SbcCD ATPase subunit
MYNCTVCNKEFKYESKLNEHTGRKKSCINNNEFNCNICKSNFKYRCDYLRHEKTYKHINNYNKIINQDEFINADANKNNADLTDYKNKIQTLEEKIINLNNTVNELNNNVVNNLNNKIKNLNNEIKHLNIENQNLKNNQSLHADYESIYIIHAGQHVNTNIYKIGRTCNINARRIQYPDGSKLLYSFCCKDSKTIENLILDYLKLNKQTFKLMDFGREYFQCDLKDLRNAVLQFID